MTDLATAPSGYSGPDGESKLSGSPLARRVSPPKWRDARLAAGLILLLGSVVVGARLIGAADHTVPLLTVAADLPAGHVLQPGDLGQVRARVVAPAGVYLAADQAARVTGHRLSRPVGRGELLANTALAGLVDVASVRDVPIVLDSLRVPRLHSGDLVDIVATFKPTSPGQPATVTTIVNKVEVIGDPANREGSSGKMRVVLRIPTGMVTTVVRATELGDVDLVSYLPQTRS